MQSSIRVRQFILLVIWIFAILVSAYIILVGYFFFRQSDYVYFPDYPERVVSADPTSIGLPYENISFVTADGVKVAGWFIPAGSSRGVLLFCHGNAGNISHRLDFIQLFHELGLDVFIFDYRGYGQSEGKPTEQGTYNDVEAAWRYLTDERQISPGQIIVFGRSLGGAVASWLAQNHMPGMLILQSTFTSLADVGAKHYPFLPVRLLLRARYSTAQYLDKVNCPVLICHSRNDELIPFSHGRQLFEIAGEPRKFLELSGSHNEGFMDLRYREELNTLISTHLH